MPKLFFGKAIIARPVCSKENGSEPGLSTLSQMKML